MKQLAAHFIPGRLCVKRLPAGNPGVLLTFDDGPHPEVTLEVLDRLEAFGARALFFVIGQRIERAAELLPAIANRGHLLGNHTFHHHDHDVLTDHKSSGFLSFYRDVSQCQETIQKHSNMTPRWFRPPGGRMNVNSLLAPWLQGLRVMTWSKEIGDWRFRTAEESRCGGRELALIVQPGDIVLLHDDNHRVLDLLDELLPALQRRNLNLWDAVDLIART